MMKRLLSALAVRWCFGAIKCGSLCQVLMLYFMFSKTQILHDFPENTYRLSNVSVHLSVYAFFISVSTSICFLSSNSFLTLFLKFHVVTFLEFVNPKLTEL